MIVLPRYEPIHTLAKDSGFPLLNAFLALVYCHAVLWSLGIQHCDISEHNLMADPLTGYPKLCDSDLSHIEGDILPECLFSNTGTWTFMAIELLTPEAMNGHVKRLYRHDVESFLAVLAWILLRYNENGQLLPDPPVSEWSDTSYLVCAERRRAIYQGFSTIRKPGWLSSDIWVALLLAINDLLKLINLVSSFKADISTKKSVPRAFSDTVHISQDEVRRMEQLNDLRFVKEVLNWVFFALQTDSPKWAPLMNKIYVLELERHT
ncbi:hypothetical protein D9613_001155 [Agrocybe pediades]|uniref:Protein kinase domain-containing protein n=1 Tax=Agrocybe pediades TaxID=84607 RepID=A0A8H4VSR7_9AGAR|nr:hypothetical protein D9613_001155 [Agrocybe pediades]